jgi:hypothetical protein
MKKLKEDIFMDPRAAQIENERFARWAEWYESLQSTQMMRTPIKKVRKNKKL